MLKMSAEDLPMEAARLGYALKTVSGKAIMECSRESKERPINFDAIAHALGMRARTLRQDYIEPTLALMGCDAAGYPRADKVHELYLATRRSGDDDKVGALVSRWLRLTFTGNEQVYILPISAGTEKRELATWVFYTLQNPRVVVATFNPVKYAREYARAHGPMRNYSFEWTKSIPGHYACLADKSEAVKPAFVSIDAIERMAPGLSERMVDCLTGISSVDETRTSVKTDDMIAVLQQVHNALEDGGEFAHLSGGFKLLSSCNMFNSPLVAFFAAAGVYPHAVQHEVFAEMSADVAKLARLKPSDAVDFLQSVFRKAMNSDEVADALALNLISNIETV